jgi:catechol 2,3-dioxygenase-like lactoylglutathione lyase family enzyme
MGRPKIRHIAVRTADPDKVSGFLQDVFGMEEVKKTPRGTIFMTDGYLTLALLAPRAGDPNGINHYGFLVDSLEPIRAKTPVAPSEEFQAGGARSPGQHSEYIVHDPEGNRIDAAEEMWPTK